MNVKQCPSCKKYNRVFLHEKAEIKHNHTEVWVSAYCPDCGVSWYIVYQPDRIEDR